MYKRDKVKTTINDKKYYESHKDQIREQKRKYYMANAKTISDKAKERHKNNPDLERAHKFKYKYGITIEHYEELYRKQNGQCITCYKKQKVLCVDHNHKSGLVRGLLCKNCNLALGFVHDNKAILQKMIGYLE